ncbi:phosphonate C-P lyase system protein PhnH [Kalamiella sp. sgz302252]|uniref:phosphonate C-P lyase system protein PhnH n=1 Tax=Pantoea sp. sgz302252 TaxID=3341827 RepID=UPI0036D2931E
MTLLASFSHSFADSQRAFRLILKALSEPGVKVALPPVAAWGNASPAATAILTTLVDRETPFWMDSSLSNNAMLENLARFGARTATKKEAAVALLNADSETPIEGFSPGHGPSTVIVEVAALSGGLTLRLSGPDLREPRAIAPKLPEAVLHYLRERVHSFPQPIDLIFTCGETMMALPHTTNVVVC